MDEAELEIAFRESAEFGIEFLHSEAHGFLLCAIRRESPGLSAADIDEVYQETLMDVLIAARKPEFDPTSPMRFVMTVLKRRTIDCARMRGLRRRKESAEYQDQHIEDMRGTLFAVRSIARTIDWPLYEEVIHQTIASLPPRQRLAAANYLTLCNEPGEARYTLLAEAMSDALGEPVPTTAAKSAWHEARAKIQSALRKRGMDLLTEET